MEVSDKELDSKKEGLSLKDIQEKALKWHDEFDEKWRLPSFHNRAHIEAVLEAHKTYIRETSDNNDPLGLRSSMAKWNETHEYVEWDEFLEVAEFVIHVHDLGNIMRVIDITEEDGAVKMEPQTLKHYTAAEVEERTKVIAEQLIRHSNIDESKKEKYVELARHLIGETTYDYGKQGSDAPFAVYMRVIDQIGNDMYSTNKGRQLGLLHEMKAEDPNATVKNLYKFLNFTRTRLPALLPDENATRVLIEDIWRKKLPKESHQDMQVEMTVDDLISHFSSAIN